MVYNLVPGGQICPPGTSGLTGLKLTKINRPVFRNNVTPDDLESFYEFEDSTGILKTHKEIISKLSMSEDDQVVIL